jgi:NADP-dependent 3-hydroxy acid dehydrogenase YdfG
VAADALAREGIVVQTVTLDVMDAASVNAVVAQAGPIDVLVNNAGVDDDTDQIALAADLVRAPDIRD